MTLTPAGSVPISNAKLDGGYVLAEVGGTTRRVASGSFATIAEMAASQKLFGGQVVHVESGTLGIGEDFTYETDSELTANGTTVVTPTGMASVGRLESKRTVYADYTEINNDPRTFADDTIASVLGEGVTYTAVSSGGDIESAGGQNWDLNRNTNGEYSMRGLGVAFGGDITDQLEAFFAKLRTAGVAETFVIDNFNVITDPIRLPFNIKLRGTKYGRLRADATFGSVTFDVSGGGTLEVSTMLWCAETAGTSNIATIGDSAGSRREGLDIDRTVVLDCNDQAGYGLFLDNIQNSTVAPKIESPVKWGLRHYSNGWGMRLWPQVLDPVEGGVWAAVAANGVDFAGAQIYGNGRVPSIAHILIDGDNNGWNAHVGFLEKGTTAVLCRTGTGPGNIYGVDVEVMAEEAIIVDGTGVTGRAAGPVNIMGCFLETDSSTTAVVKAINAIVHVTGCRIRNQSGATASGLAAFETSGTDAVIYDHGNEIESSIGSLDVNGVVTVTQDGRTSRRKVVRGSSAATVTTDETLIHADPYAYDLATAYDRTENAITNAGAQTVVSRRTLATSIHSGAAITGTAGVVIDTFGGSSNLRFRPIDDNALDAGAAANRFKTVYAGTGTINTSDMREKQDIRDIEAAEIAVGKKIPSLVKAYRWKNAVADKGDEARIHIGPMAQEIIALFESEGLDAFTYGVVCYDEWEAQPATLNSDGVVIAPAVEAGNRYSVRNDELQYLALAALTQKGAAK